MARLWHNAIFGPPGICKREDLHLALLLPLAIPLPL